jgi:hypothetical protein
MILLGRTIFRSLISYCRGLEDLSGTAKKQHGKIGTLRELKAYADEGRDGVEPRCH